MVRVMMLAVLVAGLWGLCPARATDPCVGCDCKVVQFWRSLKSPPVTYGLRKPDPTDDKLTVPADQALGTTKIGGSFLAKECDKAPSAKTGEKYPMAEYVYGGTAACQIAAKATGDVHVTMPANQQNDFVWTDHTEVEQYKCSN